MNCEKCGKPIPEERLVALPDTKRCVACVLAGGDPRVKGRNVYEHKTAGSIEVLSPKAFQEANEADPRGFGKGDRAIDDPPEVLTPP